MISGLSERERERERRAEREPQVPINNRTSERVSARERRNVVKKIVVEATKHTRRIQSKQKCWFEEDGENNSTLKLK